VKVDIEAARAAREQAAVPYGEKNISYIRDVFTEGWDAAMAWVIQQQRQRGQEEMGYLDFSDGGMPLG